MWLYSFPVYLASVLVRVSLSCTVNTWTYSIWQDMWCKEMFRYATYSHGLLVGLLLSVLNSLWIVGCWLGIQLNKVTVSDSSVVEWLPNIVNERWIFVCVCVFVCVYLCVCVCGVWKVAYNHNIFNLLIQCLRTDILSTLHAIKYIHT